MTHEVTMTADEWREIVADLRAFADAAGTSGDYEQTLKFLASRIERTCAEAVDDAPVSLLVSPTDWLAAGRAWLAAVQP